MPSTEQQLSLFVSDDVPVPAHPESQCVAPFIRDATIVPVLGTSDADWVQFCQEHGRIPMICDQKKPWEYRGWLMYYRLLLEDTGQVGYRWDYWARTMSAGRLLDEAIPQISFSGENRAGTRLAEDWITLAVHPPDPLPGITNLFHCLLLASSHSP